MNGDGVVGEVSGAEAGSPETAIELSSADQRTAAARFRRLESIYHQASELEGEAQEHLLDAYAQSPGAELDLLTEVRQMLGLEGKAEGELLSVVGSGALNFSRPSVPRRIGPYRVLSLIGQGGLGMVFLAERDDEHFRKRVAIKWARPDLGTKELELRFRAERQILAALDHPFIARILDGGAHLGHAYLVMELIEGVDLLEYCRANQLSVEAKIELFRKICGAVHYAHQSLILHLDIKPSNILIDESGSPKLVDFGIAKALQGGNLPDQGDLATQSAAGQRPLTPEYASPEQTRFRPLTTSSDIYSLGIVLYELLCSERPYRIDTTNPVEVAELVSQTPPEVPSKRYRSADLGPSAPWNPDLDAIVMKTLRKEPEERYPSVDQLSADLLRYLEDLPVLARRGSRRYVWGKMIRRYRWAVASAATVMFAWVAATVVVSHQAQISRVERQRAEVQSQLAGEERDRAEAVVELLVGLFEISDPSLAQGAEPTAREVLDQGARRVRLQLKDRPKLRAALGGTIGRVYRKLAVFDQAELHLQDSLSIYLESERDSADALESYRQLALLRLDQDRIQEAVTLIEEALEKISEPGTALESALLGTLARSRLEQGRTQETKSLAGKMLRNSQVIDDRQAIAEAQDLLAQAAYAEGKYGEAEEWGLKALAGRRETLGDLDPKVAVSLNNLAAIRQATGDLEGARTSLEETLKMRRLIYAEPHGAIAHSLHNLATVRLQEKSYDQAAPLLEEAEGMLSELHGADHTSLADVLLTRARLEQRLGRREAAIDLHRRVLAIRQTLLEPGHPDVILSLLRLADSLKSSDPEQESIYREALARQRSHGDQNSHGLAFALERLGTLLCKREPREAVELYREALEVRRRGAEPGHWSLPMGQARIGRCMAEVDPARGREHLEKAIAELVELLGADHASTQKAVEWLAEVSS